MMGTRADFYIGRGLQAVWLGSIAWDGYPSGMPEGFAQATTQEQFTDFIKTLSARDDWTAPEQGWPWPWEDSRTTDYAYAFDGGDVWVSPFGHSWFKLSDPKPTEETPKDAVFPDMKDMQNVTLGARSGVTIIGVR
jgi:hypothetical protein